MGVSNSPSSVLRGSTADLHQALDQSSLMRSLMAADLTPAVYGMVLRRLKIAHAAVEQAYAMWAGRQKAADEWLSPQVFWRTSMLENDLGALALAGVDLETDVMEADHSGGLYCETRAQVLGMAYVVCGSLLGARLIETQLSVTLGERFAAARSFFRAGLSPQLPRWSFVRQRLDAELQAGTELQQAVMAARQTFTQFQRCLALRPALEVADPCAC